MTVMNEQYRNKQLQLMLRHVVEMYCVRDGSGKPGAERSVARTCSVQPDPQGHAQMFKRHQHKSEACL